MPETDSRPKPSLGEICVGQELGTFEVRGCSDQNACEQPVAFECHPAKVEFGGFGSTKINRTIESDVLSSKTAIEEAFAASESGVLERRAREVDPALEG